jgi:hypothetical protein
MPSVLVDLFPLGTPPPHTHTQTHTLLTVSIIKAKYFSQWLVLIKEFFSFQETYESFHYTSLLYLSDYGRDFHGGRFVFIDYDNTNRTVEPRKGISAMCI